MKKFLICLSFVLALMFLVSCSEKPVNYIIYADSVYAEELEGALLDGGAEGIPEIKNASEKRFTYSSRTKTEEDKKAEKTYKIQLGEKELSLKYSKSYETEAFDSEKMKAFSKYHVYSDAMSGSYLEVNATTEEVTLFSGGNVHLSAGSQNFSKEEAKEKAADIIEQIYGKDTLESYQYYDTVITDGQSQTSYTAVYMRDVWDLKNEDKISVTFNKDGEFFGINAQNKGTLEKAEKDLSKKEIENAIAKLNDTFSDEWNIHEPSLIRDVNGDYYIQCFIYRGANGDSEGTYVYINVQ